MSLPIVHHPDYDAESVPDSHRFPMRKYSLIAELLRERGERFIVPAHAPEPWLHLAHDPAYVTAVLTSSVDAKTTRRIGFEMTPAIAARTRASVGGTCLATRLALDHGAAVSLAGGSHHAHYEGGAGFCVFNDVAVAAQVALEEGLARRVAIIDCDVHHGDGTASIFADDPRIFTASLHCEDNWPREKPPSDLDAGLPKGTGDEAYLTALETMLGNVFAKITPDLVFYNAGVDPHAEDRLGHLELSDDGLKTRDRMVAEAFSSRGIALTGVLGGGYSKDARAVARRHTFMVDALQALVAA
ncbi:histone deacetylase family protein [Henriciella aquimarina]|uniref:histone deacetylase family protein n=1 Tax=Henriciella aquimarina TaxID=545261 RepID=UPI000A03980C|nr:histone deacetylase [Henriciella aquimarina]